MLVCFFFSSRRRHTRCSRDWSSDVCSSDLLLFGGRRTFGGRAGTEAALNFGLDVAAQSFRNDPRGSKFAKVGDGELWQGRKRSGEGRVGEEGRFRGAAYHLKKKKQKEVERG